MNPNTLVQEAIADPINHDLHLSILGWTVSKAGTDLSVGITHNDAFMIIGAFAAQFENIAKDEQHREERKFADIVAEEVATLASLQSKELI